MKKTPLEGSHTSGMYPSIMWRIMQHYKILSPLPHMWLLTLIYPTLGLGPGHVPQRSDIFSPWKRFEPRIFRFQGFPEGRSGYEWTSPDPLGYGATWQIGQNLTLIHMWLIKMGRGLLISLLPNNRGLLIVYILLQQI